jgi:hypothetical protein
VKVDKPRARPPGERFSPATVTLTGGGPAAAFGNLTPLDPNNPGPHTVEPVKAS